MIKPDMVPDEVVISAREAWLRSDVNAQSDWRVAIAAALDAWPGAEYVYRQPHRLAVSYSSPAIIIPLPMENTNDQA